MKRKRGRPPGRKFPQPSNVFEGMWNATFGKLGASEAMHVVMMCPYREVGCIEHLPVGKLSKTKKRTLELRHRQFEKWNSEIGKMVGEKIAAGDYTFFHDLAAAVESLRDKEDAPHSIDRLLALEYKLECEGWGQPFTLRGLRAYYDRRGIGKKNMDSSKLSKMYSWVRSAVPSKLPGLPGK
jgi:hypothetical protein